MRAAHYEPVDPDRIESGSWCHRAQKILGEGDIAASYSADRVGMGEPIRKPFTWNGSLWVCLGFYGRSGELKAEAYRLVDPRIFEGEATDYCEKVVSRKGARSDPKGFYHGMSVKSDKTTFILCGPPQGFVPGEKQQLSLF